MTANACLRQYSIWWLLRCLGVVVIGWELSSPRVVQAQGQLLGAIHGTVKDQQGGVLPGVLVKLTPSDSLPPFTVTTDGGGFYVLRDLRPGVYAVSAQLTGFATLLQSGVSVRAGLSLSLDLVMSLGELDEVVTVTKDTPLLDTSSPASAINVSGDLQRSLPLSARKNWSDFLLLAPGIMSTESDLGGQTFNFYSHGSGFNSHVLQIDGADMASAVSTQTFRIALSTESIADVQITTSGVPASAPLGQGAVVNVATKSGTNQLRGSIAMLYHPRAWNGSNTPGGVSETISAFQPEASLGGPIQRDRVWFFASYRRVSSSTAVARSAAQLQALTTLDPAFAPRDARNRANFYFVKTNASLASGQQLSAFYQYDRNPADIASPSAAQVYPRTGGGSGVAVRLSSAWSQRLATQVSASYNDKTSEFAPPQVAGPSIPVYRTVTPTAGRLSGVGLIATLGAPVTSWLERSEDKATLAADLTYSMSFWGSHSLQSGLYIQPVLSQRSRRHYINNGLASEAHVLRDSALLSSGTIPFFRQQWDVSPLLDNASASDVAIYFHDQWSPFSRLSVTGGVRIDHVASRDRILQIVTQESTEIGPRVGALWALAADGTRTLRGHWGRIHANVAPANTSLGSVTVGSESRYDLDLDGRFETVFVTPSTTRVATNLLLDPSLHQPFVDELSLGYRHQLPGLLLLDAGYVRRLFKHGRTTVDVNGIYEDAQFHGYVDPARNEIYRLTNNLWNSHEADFIDFTISRQSRVLRFLASYSRQWRRVRGWWQPNDPASYIQPSAFPNSRGVGSPEGTLTSLYSGSSLSPFNMAVFSDGSQWRDQVLRLGLAYTTPIQLRAALNYTYQSGPWSGPVYRRLSAPDPDFGPPTLLLPNGRPVSNPLAETLRFVGPTRTDGQFRLPTYQTLNASIGYVMTLGRGRVLIDVEGFHLANGDTDQGLVVGANNQSDPNYGLGANRQRPRAAQVSLRLEF